MLKSFSLVLLFLSMMVVKVHESLTLLLNRTGEVKASASGFKKNLLTYKKKKRKIQQFKFDSLSIKTHNSLPRYH